MDANEAKVREVWDEPRCESRYRSAGQMDSGAEPDEWVIYTRQNVTLARTWGTVAEAWSAAAAYTEQVIEEARQLLREMHHIECLSGRPPESLIREAVEEAWPDSMTNDYVREICAYSRILARLESVYAAHIRGIKPEALR